MRPAYPYRLPWLRRMVLPEPCRNQILAQITPGIARVAEIPPGVRFRAFPYAMFATGEQRLETLVGVRHVGIDTDEPQYTPDIQIVAVVFESELVSALHFCDEVAPAADEAFASRAHN